MKGILKNKVAANAGWIIGGRLFHKLLAFLVGILTARYLAPSNYGLINYAATYTTFFASLCTLGINSVIVKNFIDHPEEEGKTIGTTLVLRGISSFLSALMIVGIVSVLDRDEPLTVVVVALCNIGLLFQIFETFNYWFQARLQSKFPAVATIISYVIVSGYKLILMILGKSVQWFAVATAMEYIVIGVFLFAVYRKKGGPSLSFSWSKARELLSSSHSFILSGLMVAIYASTDKLMLKQLLDDAAVGHYALAVSISGMWTFVLGAITESMYPGIVQAFDRSEKEFAKKNRQLYAIVFYASTGMSLLISIAAPLLIEILYGAEYAPAIRPLQIVVWYTAFSYLGVARNPWIVCNQKQKYLKYLYAASAVINVALNYLLIPLIGTAGAALASLLTQIATILLPAFSKELRPNVKLMLEAVFLRDIR